VNKYIQSKGENKGKERKRNEQGGSENPHPISV